MGRRQVLFWVVGSVLLGVGLLAVLVVSVLPPDQHYADWVEDSGLPTEFGRQLAWMEDGRVLFPMQRLRNPSAPPSRENLVSDLAIWTPGTAAETVDIRSEDYTSGLCYADGYLRYVTSERQDGQYVSMMGRLGRERRIAYSDRPSGTRYNGFTCRYEALPKPWIGQHLFYPLMPGHGWIWIRIQPAREPGAAILYPTADHPGIELDLNDQDVRIDCFRWTGWREAYFTDTCGRHPARGGDRLLGVWLWPDGRVEVPDLPDPRSVLEIRPVPAGFLVTILEGLTFFPGLEDQYRYGPGLYLWREGAFRQLIPGFVSDGSAVTADGCRVAFGHAPTMDALVSGAPHWRLNTLKIIDLCLHLDRILAEVPVSDPFAGRN